MPKNRDGYYRSTFVIGKTVDGKPQRVTVRGKTKKEHDEKLAEAKRLHGKGIAISEITVSQWSQTWIKVYKANATETQKSHYKAKLEKDILPVIGYMNIREVRTSHLQELLNGYSGGKVGTVNKIRIALKQLFGAAEIEGIIERNPALHLELPKLTEVIRRPLTDFERAIVYEVAKTHQCGPYILTMLFCGLRRGECIALRIDDIDFINKKIYVNKSLSLSKNIGKEKETKTKAGTREVPIPNILYPILMEYCSRKNNEDIVFSKGDGHHATKQTCAWWWKSFHRQCHLMAGAETYRNKIKTETSLFSDDITPHYMRHTYATDLYAADVDEKAQKYFLGHSSTDVTDIYRKMNESAFLRALEKINIYNSKLTLNYKMFKNAPNECQNN